MYSIQAHDGAVLSLTYSASYVISLGADDRLCVWERFQGHLLNTIQMVGQPLIGKVSAIFFQIISLVLLVCVGVLASGYSALCSIVPTNYFPMCVSFLFPSFQCAWFS